MQNVTLSKKKKTKKCKLTNYGLLHKNMKIFFFYFNFQSWPRHDEINTFTCC